MNDTAKTIEISAGTLLRIATIVFLIALFLAIWPILASIFLAIVVSASTEPTIRWLESRRVPRFISVPALYLLALGAFFGVFYSILPGLFSEIRGLSQQLPQRYEFFLQDVLSGSIATQVDFLKPAIDQALLNVQEQIGAVSANAFAVASMLFGGILSSLLVVVISFYLSLQRNGVERFLVVLTPLRHREYVSDLWRRIERRLGRWLQAQFVLAVFMGVSVFIILTVLGADFSITLAILAGILEIVPIVGPVAVGILMFLFVSIQSVLLALAVVGLYILLQQVEQNFIIPGVMSRVIGVNPILLIIAVLVGAELAGFWGILLAIPLVAVIWEVVRDVQPKQQ
jgi:predicted PurR-regulated permease PerM